jgi:hypothetical protein
MEQLYIQNVEIFVLLDMPYGRQKTLPTERTSLHISMLHFIALSFLQINIKSECSVTLMLDTATKRGANLTITVINHQKNPNTIISTSVAGSYSNKSMKFKIK